MDVGRTGGFVSAGSTIICCCISWDAKAKIFSTGTLKYILKCHLGGRLASCPAQGTLHHLLAGPWQAGWGTSLCCCPGCVCPVCEAGLCSPALSVRCLSGALCSHLQVHIWITVYSITNQTNSLLFRANHNDKKELISTIMSTDWCLPFSWLSISRTGGFSFSFFLFHLEMSSPLN